MDVIVQEQIGKAIFNERMVTSVAALREWAPTAALFEGVEP